ncbi:MAG: heparinase II/III family protein [Clostridia bacterium]|nr:heparinase II/III family protein [Clostridia bacterium]MBQ8720067.1 heparinase II/III family protein [Clostridia bacterium]
MNKKLEKLLSLILVITMLLCAFSIFASAEGESTEEEGNDMVVADLMMYRTYSEGWELTNGFSSQAPKSHTFAIEYEEDDNFNYNYFMRFTQEHGNSDGFNTISTAAKAIDDGYMFFEFSIKTDDLCGVNNILYCKNPGNTTTTYLVSTANNGTKLTLGGIPCADLGNNQWIHVVLRFQFSSKDGVSDKCTGYIAESTAHDAKLTQIFNVDMGTTDGVAWFRLGCGASASSIGDSYCLDNLTIYNSSYPDRQDITGMGHGSMVDSSLPKTVEILQYGGDKSDSNYLNEGMILKTGVNYGLIKNARAPLFDGTYGAPVVIDGKVFVPMTPVLDHLGYSYTMHADGLSYDISNGVNTVFLAVSRDVATLNGNRVDLTATPIYRQSGENKYAMIALDDIEQLFPGFYTTYEPVGLIIIAERDNLMNSDEHLEAMIIKMKQFVFDYPEGAEVYEDVREKTNGFEHPYLMATQDQFDYLHAVWTAEEGDEDYNASLKSYMQSFMVRPDKYYNDYAIVDDNGDYQRIVVKSDNKYIDNLQGDKGVNAGRHNPFEDGNGYDPNNGERLNESGEFSTEIMELAMAYQITRDIKYLRLAYDYMVAVGNWVHWGPGHFLNCADATTPYSLAFDWLFNAFEEYSDEYGFDTTELAGYIFWRGVYEGYCSVNGKVNLYGRSSNSGLFSSTANNWNAVCSSGMMIGALAVMGYSNYEGSLKTTRTELADVDYSVWDEYRDDLVKHLLYDLPNYGINEYGTDGSYIEGSGYWAYGTNTYFIMAAGLYSAAGTSYGLMESWGIDRTAYYALHSESSDYSTWNYNDGGSTNQDTSLFMFVGMYYNQPGLAYVRDVHLANGKKVTVYDLVYYKEIEAADIDLSLDYNMESIEAVVVRSSWEPGALYAGIMGGSNQVSHGDIDCGNFIYYNKGIRWIYDMGSDNYNAYGYFTYSIDARYRYFRKNCEGQNVVFLTSQQTKLPAGQEQYGYGELMEWFSNDYGAYAIYDNTSAYGDYGTDVKRGMLYTNNRETFVIQDEITLGSVEEICWVVQTTAEVTLSEDGRTAYLSVTRGGTTYYLRASIVSESTSYKFTLKGSGDKDLLLMNTYKNGASQSLGGAAEYGRDSNKRLCIQSTGLSFNFAVAFEMVDEIDSSAPVQYDWSLMTRWEEPTETYVPRATVGTRVVLGEISNYAKYLGQFKAAKVHFGAKMTEYYNTLVSIDKIMLVFTPKELTTADQKAAYQTWLQHMDLYDNYKFFIQDQVVDTHDVAKSLMGI